MRVKSLKLIKFRSFVSTDLIEFGAINVLVGANNSGKSSVLRALYCMQQGGGDPRADVRSGEVESRIKIQLTETDASILTNIPNSGGTGLLDISMKRPSRTEGGMQISYSDGQYLFVINQVLASDPTHFIVPFFSKRKIGHYQEDVRYQHTISVVPDISYLSAKLTRVSNPSFPAYERYRQACQDILGFVVTAIPSDNGQLPGIFLPNRDTLNIAQMGDGVSNIVALLADLALSEGKLFLMEEPENDLHPKALKALLDLVIESSKLNQFVISTHSNIVVRYLGAQESSRIYKVTTVPDKLPIEAKIDLVEPTPQARLEVLRDLGYSFSDFELWDGWLILEESSAERIIRDYLIPWFVPKLTRIRTLAAGGNRQVEPTFEDFSRLVRFTHLEQAYTDAAWVRVDGDSDGKEIIDSLRRRYSSWSDDRFSCFSKSQFEHYYPSVFKNRVKEVLGMEKKQDKREAKRLLLNEVRKWLDEDFERGREALASSAEEIIADLKVISSQLR